jgi:hypothetical protein
VAVEAAQGRSRVNKWTCSMKFSVIIITIIIITDLNTTETCVNFVQYYMFFRDISVSLANHSTNFSPSSLSPGASIIGHWWPQCPVEPIRFHPPLHLLTYSFAASVLTPSVLFEKLTVAQIAKKFPEVVQ